MNSNFLYVHCRKNLGCYKNVMGELGNQENFLLRKCKVDSLRIVVIRLVEFREKNILGGGITVFEVYEVGKILSKLKDGKSWLGCSCEELGSGRRFERREVGKNCLQGLLYHVKR